MWQDPTLVPVYCNACGGWDYSAGGSGHKPGCPKGEPGSHINNRADKADQVQWILLGKWDTRTLQDSWTVRGIIEEIKQQSGANIVHSLAKGPCLGIVVTDPIFGKEPDGNFGGFSWFRVVELRHGGATKDRLSRELAEHT